jgi:hypothetical protein
MTITLFVITVDVQEIVLGQLEHQREQHEELAHNLEMDVLCEIPDLVPMVGDDLGVIARVLLGEFRRVVDLRVVLDAVLDLADPERLVAVVPAVLEVGAVFELLLRGELEDLFAQAELPVDLLLREAEVDDVEEAWRGKKGRS